MNKIEAVDRFIDDAFNGNILTYFHTEMDARAEGRQPTVLVAITEDDVIREKVETHQKEFGAVVEEYLTEGGHTEANASKLYRDILALRLYGVFHNNPNNLNELNFYKDRFSDSQRTIVDLQDKLRAAYMAFDKQQERFENMGPKRNQEGEARS